MSKSLIKGHEDKYWHIKKSDFKRVKQIIGYSITGLLSILMGFIGYVESFGNELKYSLLNSFIVILVGIIIIIIGVAGDDEDE
jgi:hypothetical protein